MNFLGPTETQNDLDVYPPPQNVSGEQVRDVPFLQSGSVVQLIFILFVFSVFLFF